MEQRNARKPRIRLPELCRNSSPWVVVGLGRILRHQDPRYSRDFQIEVCIAELSEKSLLHGSRLPTSKQLQGKSHVVRTSVGNLPKLRLGSVWQDGVLEKVFHDEVLDFGATTLDPAKVDKLFSFGEPRSTEDGSIDFLINPFHLFVPNEFIGAKCVILEDCFDNTYWSDGRSPPSVVIIPCAEVIRYFFSGRRKLILELFSDGLNQEGNRIYNPAHLRPISQGGKAYIRLRLGMGQKESAWLPARIAYEPRVRHAALAIAGKLHGKMEASSDRSGVQPEESFPHGLLAELNPDVMRMRGKRVQRRDGRWSFFVYEILHFDCKPTKRAFIDVEYEPDVERGGGRSSSDKDEIAFENSNAAPAKLKDSITDVTIHNEGAASNSLDPVSFDDDESFSSFASPADVHITRAVRRESQYSSNQSGWAYGSNWDH